MADEYNAQLARIEEKVDNVLDAVSELKSDMRESRDHRNNLDRRVTQLETKMERVDPDKITQLSTKMEDVDTVKKAVIGVIVGLLVVILVVAAIVVQYVQLAP
jgi:chromosome segregation ATPase